MRHKKISLFIVLVLIIGAIASYSIFFQPQGLKVNLSKNVATDLPAKRTWIDNFILKEKKLDSAIHDSVYRGGILKRFGDYLYVGGIGQFSVKRFTLNGKYVDRFGEREGRGPGEITQFTDFTISNNKFLYLVENSKRELMKFDVKSADYLTSYSLKYQPLRTVASGKHIIVESLFDEKMFKMHDLDGKVIKEFGTIVENQVQNSLSLFGDLEPIDKAGDFIFVPAKASYIFYYNKEGKRLKTVKTMGEIPFKKSIRSTSGNFRSTKSPPADIYTMDIEVYNDKIYLSRMLAKNSNASLPKSFLDVYDLGSGSYLYSIKLPGINDDVVFTKDLVYLLTEDTELVRAYAYKKIK